MLLMFAVMFSLFLLRIYQLQKLQTIKSEISQKEKIVQKYKVAEGNLRAVYAKLQVLGKARESKESPADSWVKLQDELPPDLQVLNFSSDAEHGALFEIAAASFPEAAAFLNGLAEKKEGPQLFLRSVNFNPKTNQVFLKVQSR